MRLRALSSLDFITLALLCAGALLVAVAVIGIVVVLEPNSQLAEQTTPGAPPTPTGERAAAALPADRVATVLYLDAGVGAGSVARASDHVDVMGYFSARVTGGGGLTRVLLTDVPVLSSDRNGPSVALTLAVPQDTAVLLQEAQALGARPLVTLRSALAGAAPNMPTTFSDTDLAQRLGSRAP